MDSLWSRTAKRPQFDALSGDSQTDVLIVGGGLTGILCAYTLQQAGVPYTLLEADRICSGITKNTTAKITAQHGLIYHKLLQKHGAQVTGLYYRANAMAVERYRQLCSALDCAFDTQDAYVYTTGDVSGIKKEVDAYRKIGVLAEFEASLPLPLPVLGAVKLPDQGQLHPLEFLFRLSEQLNIKENTKVIHLAPNRAETNHGSIRFRRAIIATHFPLLNKHGSYFLKMYQHRSYVLALENGQDIDGMYVDEDKKGMSFRKHGKHLLLGGGSHRTGKKGGAWNELETFVREQYPDARIAYRWATQDCMTLDGLPYIGQYSKNTPELFTACGYNKWGFTTAMVAADLLCDLVQEKQNELTSLFSPSRSLMHPQLAVNGAEAILNLITPTTPRCPHLGCALKYNKQEHTWDCPCHGSRFTKDGKLLDNPATDDIVL